MLSYGVGCHLLLGCGHALMIPTACTHPLGWRRSSSAGVTWASRTPAPPGSAVQGGRGAVGTFLYHLPDKSAGPEDGGCSSHAGALLLGLPVVWLEYGETTPPARRSEGEGGCWGSSRSPATSRPHQTPMPRSSSPRRCAAPWGPWTCKETPPQA